MSSQTMMISSLTTESKNTAIHVRATRIWESINNKRKTLIHTNLVFVDEEGSQIAAVVWNNQKAEYFPLLKEGSVYTITNFIVVAARQTYRPVDAEFTLNFYYRTKILSVPDTGSIPKYKFEPMQFDALPGLLWSVRNFIDVIGMVESIGNSQLTSNGATKMDVRLVDIRRQPMVVTLWEEKASQFQEAVSVANNHAAFVVITGLLVKQYSTANVILSSGDGTKTYCNISYGPLDALRDGILAATGHTIETLPQPAKALLVTATASAAKEVTIQAILDTDVPTGQEVIRLLCEATIVYVSKDDGWFYISCLHCPRSVRFDGDMFNCDSCNKPMKNYRHGYRVNIGVKDGSGKTTFTIFNKDAERLIGVPIEEVISEIGQDKIGTEIPSIINNMVGRKCLFEIRVTSYNKPGRECYTVTRLSEIEVIPTNNEQGHTHEAGTSKKQRVT